MSLCSTIAAHHRFLSQSTSHVAPWTARNYREGNLLGLTAELALGTMRGEIALEAKNDAGELEFELGYWTIGNTKFDCKIKVLNCSNVETGIRELEFRKVQYSKFEVQKQN